MCSIQTLSQRYHTITLSLYHNATTLCRLLSSPADRAALQVSAPSIFQVSALVYQLFKATECGVRFKTGAWQEADHCGGFEEVNHYCLVVDVTSRAELLELQQDGKFSNVRVQYLALVNVQGP